MGEAEGRPPLGPLEEGSYKVAGNTVIVRRFRGWIEYTRISPGGAVAAQRKLAPGIRLVLAGYPPFLLPEQGLFNCVYIRLVEPVVVHQRSVTKIYVSVPYDYAVIAESGNSYLLVDVFPSEAGPPKLAVYGDLVEGMLCRFHVSRVDEEPGPGTAAMVVHIVNQTDEAASVTRIVVPRNGFNYYHLPGGGVRASDAVLTIKGAGIAEVELEEPRLPKGSVRVPLIQRERRLLEAVPYRLPEKLVMRWGF